MSILNRLLPKSGGFLDRNFAFDQRWNVIKAAIVVALLFGVISVLLGQDSNWDLRNYHLYNAYSVLHGRLGADLAPAQMQSYFVPWLDIPYYLMAVNAHPVLGGFVLGVLHGVNFLLVAGISWQALKDESQRSRLAPLLGLAGCCSAVFLSELGGTMGDNTTALFMLGGLWALLVSQQGEQSRWPLLLFAALLLGMGVAFKMTNAIYAIGMGMAMLAGSGGWCRRLGNALVLTVVTAIVFGLIAGPWLWMVWQAFGNPLFPQFNAWFGAPLAQHVMVGDTRWLPDNLGKALIWPVLFTVNPRLISEGEMPQIIWVVVYLLFLGVMVKWTLGRFGIGAREAAFLKSIDAGNSIVRMTLFFFAAAFLAWLVMFSIHRYLAVLELLAPLVVWLLIRRLVPSAASGRLAGCLIALCVAVSLLGWNPWGHKGWKSSGFSVEQPQMNDASHATVLLVGDEPQSWKIPFLPAEAVYVSVASNFPESAVYVDRIIDTVEHRNGQVYAMFPASVDKHEAKVLRLNAWAQKLGLSRGKCRILGSLAERSSKMDMQAADPVKGLPCRLVVSAGAEDDIPALNQVLIDQSDQKLQHYGLDIEHGSCRVHGASIGDGSFPYHWCVLTPR